MADIAFLGIGAMGAPMSRCLLKGGHRVTVWNRSPAKANALVKDGARVAPTPRDAVEGVDAIFTMLIDDTACRAVWTGPDGALSGKPKPGAFAIESSTVSNAWVHELAGLAEARGLRFMDCCVAGRPDAAEAAQLNVFAGGRAEDVEAAAPILKPMSKSITHFGPVGMGNAFKLIYNVLGALQVASLAEAMHACEAAGIDLKAAARAFSEGNTNSGHVIRHSRYMASGKHEDPVQFSARSRIKDILYGVEFIEKIGGQARIGRTAAEVFGQAVDVGMGDRNDSELIDALRRIHPGRDC
ncbi:MAG: NAD(P)-dependent oxidoreductase [Hyphomicrobiaceae bacterium]